MADRRTFQESHVPREWASAHEKTQESKLKTFFEHGTDTALDSAIAATEQRTGALLRPRMVKPGMRDRVRAILASAFPTTPQSEDDWNDGITLIALAWAISREEDRRRHEPEFGSEESSQ